VEQVSHIIVEIPTLSIYVCSNRGRQMPFRCDSQESLNDIVEYIHLRLPFTKILIKQ